MTANTSCNPAAGSHTPISATPETQAPQMALLDVFFPGFSVFSGAIYKYLHIDLNLYIPLLLLLGGGVFAWQYFSDYFWGQLETHFMSTVDVRTDDETYNMLMSWVASQRFSQGARRFIVNTNLNSRAWCLWRWHDDSDDEEEDDETSATHIKKKSLSYTPTFGSHYFWYKGRLLIFRRNQNRDQATFMVASEREEISISCFGRDPQILKQLLHEARDMYNKRDERKTVIYRGTLRAGSTEPTWQRCLARTSRPFSTVILNEKVKQELIEDVSDYLNPATRRWYSNRGIPYRRGILLWGPPGCGKSSLSLALSGAFHLPIYICSLSSVTASEETLATLFAELPRRCVVLLEDIDTAGLTHTREEDKPAVAPPADDVLPGQVTRGMPGAPAAAPQANGRLSLSGLLNILDGVASQEGRVLIMTTNHLEKLDKALIRPGRVDRIVKFDLADRDMIAALFRALYAPLEGDELPSPTSKVPLEADEAKKRAEAEAKMREEATAKVKALADEFASKIPAHEFSPAELQGYLMKNKRDPEGAVARADEFVTETRKEKKEKELRAAEEKRKADEEAEKKKQQEEEAEKKKKQQEEEAEKKKQRKEKKKAEAKKKRKAKKDESDSSDSSSSSDSDSASDVESPASRKPKTKNKEKPADAAAEPQRDGKKEERAEKEADKADEAKQKQLKVEEGKTGADSGYGTP